MRDSILGLQDHDLSWTQSLNQLSHSGAPPPFFSEWHVEIWSERHVGVRYEDSLILGLKKMSCFAGSGRLLQFSFLFCVYVCVYTYIRACICILIYMYISICHPFFFETGVSPWKKWLSKLWSTTSQTSWPDRVSDFQFLKTECSELIVRCSELRVKSWK